MTLDEITKLLCFCKMLYPRDRSFDKTPGEMSEIAQAWAVMLQDIPFELGKAAVSAHVANCPYAPAISEIRAYARKFAEPEAISAEEAWAKAIRAVRRYGTGPRNFTTGKFPYEMARDSVPAEVWRTMDLLGYQAMCLSENTDVLRAHFIRTFERQRQLREERQALLPFLPEDARQKVKGLLGEGREEK